ncbi:MAG: pantetheine-phosphate adenylyltransferase [Oligoflexales bacterium]|nr:pantetheine-phosphate adenylyltransferase [Oligoflexales bacterium]
MKAKVSSPKIAIYVGTFDPLTYGHLDIIERGSKIFDELVVSIGNNATKKEEFSVLERTRILEEVCKGISSNIRISSFSGLAIEHALSQKAHVLLRGLRTEADFVYEMQMAMMNRTLCKDLETMFIPTRQDLSHISSSLVKEIAKLGGSLSQLVPLLVEEKLKQKYRL